MIAPVCAVTLVHCFTSMFLCPYPGLLVSQHGVSFPVLAFWSLHAPEHLDVSVALSLVGHTASHICVSELIWWLALDVLLNDHGKLGNILAPE